MSTSRIVVTGIGASSPIGGTAAESWSALLAGTSGASTLDYDWVAQYDLPVTFAAEALVRPDTVLDRPEAKRLDPASQFALVAAREVVPPMRAAGRGTVLLTGSIAADRASTSAAAVGVAKAGLRSLARSLHKEVADDGVRVTTVTIDGVLSGPKALDIDEIADLYHLLHTQPHPPPDVVTFPTR